MIIRVRRGLEANRESYTPQSGEPTFTADEKKLYIGDGVTPGGILVDLSGSGIVQTVVAGTNITVDSTDPANPVVSSTGGGGGGAVDSVNGQIGEVVLDKGDIGLSNVPNTDFTSAIAANTAKVSYTDAAKVATIESGADVTDATNVTSAGALMDSEVTNLAQVKAFDETDYATAAQGSTADSAVQPGDLATVATTGAYSDLTGTPTIPTISDTAYNATSWNGNTDGASKNAIRDKIATMDTAIGLNTAKVSYTDASKMATIETGADVTDATNVAAAGAPIPTGTPDGTKFLRDDKVWTAIPGGGTSTTNNFNDKKIDQVNGGTTPYGALAGLVNSSNTLYTVSNGSYTSGALDVYLNGQRQTIGSTGDVTETTPASGTFTFAIAPPTGSIITAVYTTLTTSSNSLAKTLFTSNAQKNVNNTIAEYSVISTTGVGSMTIPANSPQVGSVYKLEVSGSYQTPVVANGVTIRPKIAGTTAATKTVSGSVLSSGSTVNLVTGWVMYTFRSIGASGTVVVDGVLNFETSLSGVPILAAAKISSDGATVSVDTTSTMLIDVTAQWGGTATATQGTKIEQTILGRYN